MRLIAAALLMSLPGLALAEVKTATATAFELEHKAVVAAPPARVWEMLGQVGSWWNKAHTYSGDAANLRMELRAGGCFCESLPAVTREEQGKQVRYPAGSVEHGRVISAMPGSMLVLNAPLGPIQSEAAVGTWSWTLRPVDGGTEIVQRYLVAGHIRNGAETLAPLVDAVMSEQFAGLQRALTR